MSSGDVKRVLVTDWGTRNMAAVKKPERYEVRGGVKSPIVTEVERDMQVSVLESMEKWSRFSPNSHGLHPESMPGYAGAPGL